MEKANIEHPTSFLPHHLVTFLKDRLVFVDVALENIFFSI